MRLGVDSPEEGVLPVKRATPTPNKPGKLDVDGDGVIETGVGGADDLFKDECLGGDGGRVDEWCVDLVRRRDTEAVAVDVPEDATGIGERGMKAGAFSRSGFLSSGA